ncbi:hypothetical protein FLAG1_10083 [Fusarium langsethiae]|uniref:Secreted LysM effector LysM C-terminal domain-containing protein n=1 Tax=Fusarium langsethiae TaxID=179993 RepID=A0A0M9EP98_FUSLA|nr:hypothetical protein FLAG1_10083 [Fusarium langsethiae]GKU09084.1 unnamed protein product [Fusarium langsethiae]
MHFSSVTAVVLATLATGSQAWQVTAYNNGANCKATSSSTYRVISGATNNNGCMTFGGSMKGIKCTEYINGGKSNRGCGGTGFNARSMILEAGRCVVYDQPNCGGRYADSNGPTNRGCSTLENYNWGSIKSFWCSGFEHWKTQSI